MTTDDELANLDEDALAAELARVRAAAVAGVRAQAQLVRDQCRLLERELYTCAINTNPRSDDLTRPLLLGMEDASAAYKLLDRVAVMIRAEDS